MLVLFLLEGKDVVMYSAASMLCCFFLIFCFFFCVFFFRQDTVCFNLTFASLEQYGRNRETKVVLYRCMIRSWSPEDYIIAGEIGGDDGTGKTRSNAEFQPVAKSKVVRVRHEQSKR